MRYAIPTVACLGLLLAAPAAMAAGDGETLFQQKCAGCHTVGGGNTVGPDLKGVAEKRDHAWLVKFIVEPDQVIASGDPIAKQLMAEFGEMPMPNMSLSEAQAESVLAFIGGGAPAEAPKAEEAPKAPGDARLGARLFHGETPFAKGGASCNSCHHAGGSGLGGGTLAKDLTDVYGRLGPAGLEGALKTLPFPVMKDIYQDKPLTSEEVAALGAYFQQVDEQKPPAAATETFVGVGAVGALGLFAGMAVFWPRRRQSVREKLQGGQK